MPQSFKLLFNFFFRYAMQSIFVYIGIIIHILKEHSILWISILIFIALLREYFTMQQVLKDSQNFYNDKEKYPNHVMTTSSFNSTYTKLRKTDTPIYIKKKNCLLSLFSFKEEFAVVIDEHDSGQVYIKRDYSYL